MANRRMFSKDITMSDLFLEMPLSSQALYFHLGMVADDDGFVASPKRTARMSGANEDDLKILLSKNLIIGFESGIVVITHWKVNNHVRMDRYKQTIHQKELQMLNYGEDGSYLLDNVPQTIEKSTVHTKCIPNAYQMDTQVRLGKDRLGKDRLEVVEDSATTTTAQKNIFQIYQENQIQPDINQRIAEELEDFEKDMNIDCIQHAIETAYDCNKRSWSYVRAILNRYKSCNFKILADVIADEDAKQNKKNENNKPQLTREQEMILALGGSIDDIK